MPRTSATLGARRGCATREPFTKEISSYYGSTPIHLSYEGPYYKEWETQANTPHADVLILDEAYIGLHGSHDGVDVGVKGLFGQGLGAHVGVVLGGGLEFDHDVPLRYPFAYF